MTDPLTETSVEMQESPPDTMPGTDPFEELVSTQKGPRRMTSKDLDSQNLQSFPNHDENKENGNIEEANRDSFCNCDNYPEIEACGQKISAMESTQPNDYQFNKKVLKIFSEKKFTVERAVTTDIGVKVSCGKPDLPDIGTEVDSENQNSEFNSSKINGKSTILNSWSIYPQGIVEVLDKRTRIKKWSFFATLIGPNFLLTAAHNLFDQDGNLFNSNQKMQFVPAINRQNYHLEFIEVVQFYYPQEFNPHQKINNNKDFAVLVLERQLHRENGYFGLHACVENSNTFKIYSYNQEIEEMKENQVKLTKSDKEYIYYSTIEQTILLNESCAFYESNDGCYIFGIPQTNTLSEKSVLKLSAEILNQIIKWMEECVTIKISEKNASKLPDLIRYHNINVWSLELTNCNLSDQELLLLKDWKALENLHTLKLSRSSLTQNDLKVVFEHKDWKHLQRLQLSYNKIGSDGAKLLSQNKTLSNLRTIELSNCLIGDESIIALTQNTKWNDLCILDLSHNQITSDGVRTLAQTKDWINLLTLDLSHNYIGSSGASELAQNNSWTQLQSLDVSYNSIKDTGTAALAQNSFWSNLNILNISHNRIGVEGISVLAQNSSWRSLHTLILSWNKITSNGVAKLAQNTSWINLQALYLDANNIDDKGAAELAHNKTWNNLKILDLSHNDITDEGVASLKENESWLNLQNLDLSCNNIQNADATIFDPCARIWRNLSSLRISSNKIAKNNAEAMTQNFEWENLRSLDLSGNKLGENDLMKVVASTNLPRLHLLDISSNHLFDIDAEVVAQNPNWADLRTLIMSNNCINAPGATKLAQNSKWDFLNELHLDDNNIGDNGVKELALNETWINLNILQLSKNNISTEGAKHLALNNTWRKIKVLELSHNRITNEGALILCQNKAWPLMEEINLYANQIDMLNFQEKESTQYDLSIMCLEKNGNTLNLSIETAFLFHNPKKAQKKFLTARFQSPKPSSHYVGRPRKFAKMAKFLNTSDIVYVSGCSGVGKTEFVSQFVNQSCYSQVLWLTASQELLLNQMWLFIHNSSKDVELHLPTENEVLSKFSRYLPPYSCLIFDNVSNIDMIQPYFDKILQYKEKSIHIIIICPYKQKTNSSVNLKPLRSSESAEYVRKELGYVDPCLKRFTELLGGLPLILKQATHHLKQSKLNIEKYCQNLEAFEKKNGLNLEGEINSEKDKDSDFNNKKLLVNVLSLVLSESEPVPDQIHPQLVLALCHFDVTISREMLFKCIPEESKDSLGSSILYDLCNLSDDHDTITISMFKQSTWRSLFMEEPKNEIALKSLAATILSLLSYKEQNLESSKLVSMVAPHALSLINSLNYKNIELIAKITLIIAHHQLCVVGDLKAALNFYRRLSQLLEQASEKTYPEEIALLNNLSDSWNTLNYHSQLRDLLNVAVKFSEIYFNSDDIFLAYLFENLGEVWGTLQNFENSRSFLMRALEIKEKYFDLDHIQIAETREKLANAWEHLGNYQSQKELLIDALATMEKHFDSQNPRIGIIMTNLGNAYGNLGDYENQKFFLEKALEIKEKYYGSEHIQTVVTLIGLGNAWGCLGDNTKEIDLQQKALEVLEKRYPDNFSEITATLDNLGKAWGELRDYEKGKSLLMRSLSIKEKHYDENNPQLAITLTNLGNTWGSLGDYQQQKELLLRALKIYQKHYGEKHPNTCNTLINLAIAWYNYKKYEHSRDLLLRALEISKECYGIEHLTTGIIHINLATTYNRLDRHELEKDELLQARGIFEKYYEPSDTKIGLLLISLGKAWKLLDKSETAIIVLNEA